MYLLGAGGHAASLLDSLGPDTIEAVVLVDEAEIAAFKSQCLEGRGLNLRTDVAVLTDAELLELEPSAVRLVNGIGQIACEGPRTFAAERFRERGFSFAQVVHPQAIVSSSAHLAAGVQVLAGAVVGARARIEENTIVNTRAVVEHDVTIHANCHIAPGAIVCGDVTVHANAVVGAGATVIQGQVVGSYATVGAGSVVIDEVAAGTVVAGVPATRLTKRDPS